MTKQVKFSIIIAISASIAMNSCGGGGNTENKSNDVIVSKTDDCKATESKTRQFFKIKQATVVYDLLGGLKKETVYFDDYGAKMRIDENDFITFFDEAAGNKVYRFDIANQTYQEGVVKELYFNRHQYLMPAVSDENAGVDELTKSNETIAGKECIVYTAKTGKNISVFGGWNGISFFTKSNDNVIIRAVSFEETIPGNIFDLPKGYTKITNNE